jgi:hypothetical protein
MQNLLDASEAMRSKISLTNEFRMATEIHVSDGRSTMGIQASLTSFVADTGVRVDLLEHCRFRCERDVGENELDPRTLVDVR